MGTPHLFISLTNRSSTKNYWREVIKGKKSGKLANLNLVGKLAEGGAESSLWKLKERWSQVFGIAQTCDAGSITTCGCGSPRGGESQPEHRKEVNGGNNEATDFGWSLTHGWCGEPT